MATRPEIALLGGSFNPPHVAHVMLAWWALATQGVREVWLLPAYRHPFGKQLAPFEDRVAMCRLAVAAVRGAHVCTAEAELRDDPLCGKTARTLEHLRGKHPDLDFALLVGADILPDTGKWYRWDRVNELARVVVVGREGYQGGAEVRLPISACNLYRNKVVHTSSIDYYITKYGRSASVCEQCHQVSN